MEKETTPGNGLEDTERGGGDTQPGFRPPEDWVVLGDSLGSVKVEGRRCGV